MAAAAEAIPLDASHGIVRQVRDALDVELAEIWADLDWGDPAVAFYGETNAGKSTLIEGLRLLFRSTGHAVGSSIGDGTPDFTRAGMSHACEHDGVCFKLIDVPGIEGDEAIVIAEIEQAVRRAHAVLYVTADARPPQGGDGGSKGTLEKIEQQLRPQAEVWAIYNKKMQNPRQFGDALLTEDEARSLAEGAHSLDAKMRDVLKDRYRGHLAVSALPGFLALAAGAELGERLGRQQQKFLQAMPADVLLEASGLMAVGQQVVQGLPTREEVVSRNVRKLSQPVAEAASELPQRAEAEFATPAALLGSQLEKLRPVLDEIVSDGSRGINRLVDELTNGYISRVRKTMLDTIERGLKDDAAMKRELDAVIEAERERLPEVVRTRVSDTVERTRRSTDEQLYLFRKHLQDVRAFDSPIFAASFSHAAEVNTRSGIEWGGVISSAIGLGLASLATGGAALIFAGLSTLVSIAFSIRKWFDPKHKQGQQKRALNSNLDTLKPNLRADVAVQLQNIENSLTAHVQSLMEPLRLVEHGLLDADRFMREAAADLRQLAASGEELRAYAARLAQPRLPTPFTHTFEEAAA